MPGRCASSARPSAFQKAVAASTRRASSALTAWKPIVVVRTLSGSPPSPATTERSTASSDGSPLTPARLPSSSFGDRICGWASTAASGPLHERHHADDVAALLAREPEVVDVEDRQVGAAGLQQLQRVGRRAGRLDLQLHALGLVVAALGREVEARVDRVRLEVEQQRGLDAGPVAAGGGAATRQHEGEEEDADARGRTAGRG